MDMASKSDNMQSILDPVDRLLVLPTELRNEIYSYLLPYPLPNIMIRARYARLHWICTTRALFNDVAPSLYSNAWFTTYLKLELKLDTAYVSREALAHDFREHLRLTYGRDAPNWVFTDACRMIRHITVDVAAPDQSSLRRTTSPSVRSIGLEDMALTFNTYFTNMAQVSPELQNLRICFHDQLLDPQECPSSDLRTALLRAVERLKDRLPTPCELEVSQLANGIHNAQS